MRYRSRLFHMYHISEEYRVGHRRARYHYNRARLIGLIPAGVSLAFLYFAGDFYLPLLYAGLGTSIALHIMLWTAYEAHFAGHHTRWTHRRLENSDNWFPSFLIICQNGFFVVTLAIFWFIVCQLGFPASLLDQFLLGSWVFLWPVLRVLRARLYVDASNSTLETSYEFFRFTNICIVAFLIASLITDFSIHEGSGDPNPDLTMIGIFVWLPAVLVAVGCVVMFLDYLLRKRPRQPRKDEFDVL
jgi:hypothetical protein